MPPAALNIRSGAAFRTHLAWLRTGNWVKRFPHTSFLSVGALTYL